MQDVKRFTTRVRPSFWMFCILVVGFILRTWHLTIKPVHFDEGINGHFVETIWRNGYYHYDPTNFHGPLFFYILALAERVFGFGIFGFRFVTGLLQMGILYVIGLHRRFVGATAIWAAFIICLSPAFVFYSRYSIHESLYVLSEVAFSYGYFLYREEKSTRSVWWMTLAVVGLVTTKETFFIFLGTWFIAVGVTNLFDYIFPKFRAKEATPQQAAGESVVLLLTPPIQSRIAIYLVGVIITLALYTGFFLYPNGAVDMIRAFGFWAHTGTAHTGHEKPFFYWIDLLRRYEWPSLIGLCLTPLLYFFADRPLRILLLVGFGGWLSSSLIPYKTPWLILGFLWALAFGGGAVINRVLPPFKKWRGLRTGVAIACFAAIFFSAGEMLRLNFRDYAKVGEPYVYVQSTQNFKDAIDTIFNHTDKRPEDIGMRVLSLNRDPWPLPYLLQPLTNVTWGRANTMEYKDADVILSDIEDEDLIRSKITRTYYALPFQIRDSYQNGWAYLSTDKFKDEVPTGTLMIGAPVP